MIIDLSAIEAFAHTTGRVIEVAGIVVIVLGSIAATAAFAGAVRLGFDQAYRRLRENLGRAILLGLELLVAADIINTVAIEPTLENMSVLAMIVLIRTFLSFSLEVEIEGRWPWQKRQAKACRWGTDPGGNVNSPPHSATSK